MGAVVDPAFWNAFTTICAICAYAVLLIVCFGVTYLLQPARWNRSDGDGGWGDDGRGPRGDPDPGGVTLTRRSVELVA